MVKKRADIHWLIPAEPYHELFRELIGILAQEFDAPNFTPHITLCPAQDRHQLRGPIRLQVREIAFSSKFTKTLFVRFSPNES